MSEPSVIEFWLEIASTHSFWGNDRLEQALAFASIAPARGGASGAL